MSVYFGVETDGDLSLRLSTDGGDQAYRLSRNGPMARAEPAKGVAGRLWNMTLEIDGATYFELDTIEAMVAESRRRLGRG
ncbi:hypothetical protein [Pseudomonas citronellolis]|uniref:hypothetical protein n=1 Tax=Pseudomonas citronellolis TaxID=53408 RepID=UPI0021C1AD9C|nr:hypothetical protein [Pseudomonas citronellolis]UXJ54870.1 hypothetical protein N5P21_11940 [Pseudomonas citronellolis]